jgi:hypothetical protein
MGKRKEDYECENCISFKDKLKAKEYELEQKVRSITETCMQAQKDTNYWRKRANAAELKYTSQFDKDLQLDSVESDTCTKCMIIMRSYCKNIRRSRLYCNHCFPSISRPKRSHTVQIHVGLCVLDYIEPLLQMWC